jgi:hypothetical protein
MLNKLLKVKHWQLFIIVVGMPIVVQSVFMVTVFTQISEHNPPDPFAIFSIMPWMFVFYLISMLVLFGWFYAIVIKMDALIPAALKLNMRRFKIFFFVPLIYFAIIFSILIFVMTNIKTMRPPENVGFIVSSVFLIIPIHLFSIFCIGHTFYCVGKSIKVAEVQRPVKFEDFVGEFFLAWFYLVGFWILQPRLNKLVDEVSKPEIVYKNNSDIL